MAEKSPRISRIVAHFKMTGGILKFGSTRSIRDCEMFPLFIGTYIQIEPEGCLESVSFPRPSRVPVKFELGLLGSGRCRREQE